MIQELTSYFFKFGIREPFSLDTGSKWNPDKSRTRLQILIESKLFLPALSNKSLKWCPGLLHDPGVNQLFFSELGIRDPLNFDTGSKWNSETRQTDLLFFLASAFEDGLQWCLGLYFIILHGQIFLQIWDQWRIYNLLVHKKITPNFEVRHRLNFNNWPKLYCGSCLILKGSRHSDLQKHFSMP